MAAWRHPFYSIQLGAYRDADNAEKAVVTFRQQGLDASQEYLPRNGQSLWVVMAGRYATLRDAEAALAGIRQRQQPQASIIP
jgi:septal ring-binding cell division protein DamX